MRPSHILRLVALVCAVLAVIALIMSGKLKGRHDVLMLSALGYFVVPWVAKSFGC
jgi:hypothetical protein